VLVGFSSGFSAGSHVKLERKYLVGGLKIRFTIHLRGCKRARRCGTMRQGAGCAATAPHH
jgi:hypothetical protein